MSENSHMLMENDDSSCELNGTILRRRCLGQFIAFADISITFRKDDLETNNFPLKKSALPFGAKCRAKLIRALDTTDGWIVQSWELTNNPRCEAIEHARLPGGGGVGGGVSLSHYLRERRSVFEATLHGDGVRPRNSTKEKLHQDSYQTGSSHSMSGNAHKVFAVWLKDHLLSDRGENYVLDVGGGKGRLSMELTTIASGVIKCTVMDPVQRKPLKMKRLIKQGKSPPDFVVNYFANQLYDGLPLDGSWAEESTRQTLAHTCLVGLHPDQCTEDIVDAALRHGKPFAVVPCCVYPDLFAMRKLKNGRNVRSYEDFLLI